MTEPDRGLVWGLRIAHLAWALPCVAISAVLVMARGGHPPGFVYLPLALVAWGLGHLFLWGAGRLASRGLEAWGRDGHASRWPWALVVSLLATGLVTAAGLALLVRMAVDWDLGVDAWTATLLAVWLPHGACFVGLLLRRAWSRGLAAALAWGWVGILVWQFFTTTDFRPWDVPLAVILGAALLALGWVMARSDAVRRALPRDSTG